MFENNTGDERYDNTEQEGQQLEQSQEELQPEPGEESQEGADEQQSQEVEEDYKKKYEEMMQALQREKAKSKKLEGVIRNKKGLIQQNHDIENQRKKAVKMLPPELQEKRNKAKPDDETLDRIKELEERLKQQEAEKLKALEENSLQRIQAKLWHEYGDELKPNSRSLFNADIAARFRYDSETGEHIPYDEKYTDYAITTDEWFAEWKETDNGSLAKKPEQKEFAQSLGKRTPERRTKELYKYPEVIGSLQSELLNCMIKSCKMSGSKVELRQMQNEAEYMRWARGEKGSKYFKKYNDEKPESLKSDIERLKDGRLIIFLKENNDYRGMSSTELAERWGWKHPNVFSDDD